MVKWLQILTVFVCLCGAEALAALPPPHKPVTAPPATAHKPVVPKGAAATAAPAAEPDINKIFRGSFFFSPLEIADIEQALEGHVRKSTGTDTTDAPIPQHRVIQLSGVYYRSPGDWVVWMNGQKVTPANLLPQIVSIHVSPSSRVHLQWYDIGLNQVLALTLRPNQTYDITSGVLLPGAH